MSCLPSVFMEPVSPVHERTQNSNKHL